jgi:hypothetical protein
MSTTTTTKRIERKYGFGSMDGEMDKEVKTTKYFFIIT